MRGALISLAMVVACLSSGCSRLSTEYGQSRGMGGRSSLNGFGALRAAYEHAGFRTRDVSRLTDRVGRTDVMVWTPRSIGPIDSRVTNWFDRWLRQGNRTLVYVIPDSGSEVDYWLNARGLAPPEQRLEYRKLAGQAINQRIQWRLNRSSIQGNGWFKVTPTDECRLVTQLQGPWSDLQQSERQRDPSLDGLNSNSNESEGDLYPAVEFVLESDEDGAAPSGSNANKIQGMVASGPTGPGATVGMMPATSQRTSTPIDFKPLLAVERNHAIIGEVTSNQWRNSRILVVAGGSLLTNYAFTRDFNRRLADKLIAQSAPSSETQPVVGFLTSDWGSVPISEREPNSPQTTGMEFLTEWPISVVTMHGVVLGIIVCLMLFPIFGRPRKQRRTEANEFGHHLDAVAALMNRVGGETYARGRISDYMKRMHGETSGPWVLPDRPSTEPKPDALPRSDQKRLTSKGAVPISAASDPQSDQGIGKHQ